MFQTGVCRISVALYVFYGTYIYYIMFDQDGTPLFNFKIGYVSALFEDMAI